MGDILHIIQKKLNAKKLSAKEEVDFARWITYANNINIFNDYQKVWDLSMSKTNSLKPDIEAQWQTFKSNRNKAISKTLTIRSFINNKFAIAASIIVIIGMTFLLQYILNTPQNVYISNNTTLEVSLPDNSVVVLNKNSSLSVYRGFNKNIRTVKLTGEALFNVTKNPDIPFIVKMNEDANVKVLGTVFNLRAYKDSKDIELKVLSGKVLFTKDNNNIPVTKGMEVDLNTNINEFTELRPIDLNMLAWNTKEIKFDNTPINEIAIALERFLGKKIQFPNNNSHILYTGQFNHPNEEAISTTLALSMGWNFKITDTSIVFYTK